MYVYLCANEISQDSTKSTQQEKIKLLQTEYIDIAMSKRENTFVEYCLQVPTESWIAAGLSQNMLDKYVRRGLPTKYILTPCYSI